MPPDDMVAGAEDTKGQQQEGTRLCDHSLSVLSNISGNLAENLHFQQKSPPDGKLL